MSPVRYELNSHILFGRTPDLNDNFIIFLQSQYCDEVAGWAIWDRKFPAQFCHLPPMGLKWSRHEADNSSASSAEEECVDLTAVPPIRLHVTELNSAQDAFTLCRGTGADRTRVCMCV
jgi:hypothetical protein